KHRDGHAQRVEVGCDEALEVADQLHGGTVAAACDAAMTRSLRWDPSRGPDRAPRPARAGARPRTGRRWTAARARRWHAGAPGRISGAPAASGPAGRPPGG